jgi:LPXTG-motif cell wall-anchored protein
MAPTPTAVLQMVLPATGGPATGANPTGAITVAVTLLGAVAAWLRRRH